MGVNRRSPVPTVTGASTDKKEAFIECRETVAEPEEKPVIISQFQAVSHSVHVQSQGMSLGPGWRKMGWCNILHTVKVLGNATYFANLLNQCLRELPLLVGENGAPYVVEQKLVMVDHSTGEAQTVTFDTDTVDVRKDGQIIKSISVTELSSGMQDLGERDVEGKEAGSGTCSK